MRHQQICFLAALLGIAAGSCTILTAGAQSVSPKAAQDTVDTPINPKSSTTLLAEPKTLASVLGIEVRTSAERNIGRVVDLLVNRAGHVDAAVIELGGFLGVGTRKIAIDWTALHLETVGKQTAVRIEITRDQLRAIPEYKPNQPVVVRKIVQPTQQPEITINEPAVQSPTPKKSPARIRKRRALRCQRS
jgi:PRC-barrel domain